MSDQEREQKQYELRIKIEADLYELEDWGFTVDEVEEFVLGVVSDMRDEEGGQS